MGVVKLSTAGILDYSKTSNFLSGNAPVSFGAFDLLETQTLASSASSVTFTGLGSYSDYKHLQIRATGRSARADTGSEALLITLNGDTGSNYAWHRLRGFNYSVSSAAGSAQTAINLDRLMPNNNEASGIFGSAVIDFLDFSSISKNTTLRALAGANPAGANPTIGLFSGLYNSTSAVTSITLQVAFGFNLTAGSRFSLYGVK